MKKTIQNDLIASAHGAPKPDYAKPIANVWNEAVCNTVAALEQGVRNIGGDTSLPDADLLNMGDVSTIIDMSVEEVMLALRRILEPSEPLLMNPFTGSVAPESEWRKDYEYMMQQEDGDCLWGGKEFDDAGLVEVRKDENGDWVRV
jgi:hypothetical protein